LEDENATGFGVHINPSALVGAEEGGGAADKVGFVSDLSLGVVEVKMNGK
jgi:hypothetical protein